MSQVKNIIFDADGTLLRGENPYLSLATKLDCVEEMMPRVQAYLDKQQDYRELVAWQADLFKRAYAKKYGYAPRTGDFERLMDMPEVREGVSELIGYVMGYGVKVFVLSSGFRSMILELTKSRIPPEHVYANRFLYDITGEFVTIHVDVTGDKIQAVDRLVQEHELRWDETAYIGDNAFDEYVINHLLELGGQVFFLDDSKSRFSWKQRPTHERLKVIEDVRGVLRYLEDMSSSTAFKVVAPQVKDKRLVVMCGMPASGKSTMSEEIAMQLGFERLSTDQIRLSEVVPGASKHGGPQGKDQYYRVRQQTYERLAEMAVEQLRQGKKVVLDGTFMDELRDLVMERVLQEVSPEEVALVVIQTDELLVKRRVAGWSVEQQEQWQRLYDAWKRDFVVGKYWFPRDGELPWCRADSCV